MNERQRRTMLVLSAGVLVGFLMWGFSWLPPFAAFRGDYGLYLNDHAVEQTHVLNVVNAVLLDYRVLDTLIEEMVLLAAVIGVGVLLRSQREEEEHSPQDHAKQSIAVHTSDAVKTLALAAVPPTVLLGLFLVGYGHLSPGGGFQGGVVLGTAPLFLYMAGRYIVFRRLNPVTMLDFAKGPGMGGMIGVGLAGLVIAGALFTNVLPLGTAGELFAGGTIPVLNVLIAIGVAAGIVLLVFEFLEQALMIGGE